MNVTANSQGGKWTLTGATAPTVKNNDTLVMRDSTIWLRTAPANLTLDIQKNAEMASLPKVKLLANMLGGVTINRGYFQTDGPLTEIRGGVHITDSTGKGYAANTADTAIADFSLTGLLASTGEVTVNGARVDTNSYRTVAYNEGNTSFGN